MPGQAKSAAFKHKMLILIYHISEKIQPLFNNSLKTSVLHKSEPKKSVQINKILVLFLLPVHKLFSFSTSVSARFLKKIPIWELLSKGGNQPLFQPFSSANTTLYIFPPPAGRFPGSGLDFFTK
jgi:hypothetical protein